MSVCVGELCSPSLKTPTNGRLHCTGPQVTGESCHFSCDPGYQLAGSSIRECLSNHSWSGIDSSCPPLQCPMLEAPMNALIVSPCDHSFKSECTIICNEGYHVTNKPSNQHHWTQSCVLHNSQSSVLWSEALSCSGIDADYTIIIIIQFMKTPACHVISLWSVNLILILK